MPYSKERRLYQNQDKKMSEGKWNDNLSWEFFLAENIPDKKLCTAVCCVTIYKNKLVLVKNKRGWELPAGHVEDGEDIIAATFREVLEETGLQLQKTPTLFGYKRVTAQTPVLKDEAANIYYPFPNSYVGFFFAETVDSEGLETFNDVSELTYASYQEARALLSSAKQYEGILEYLISNRRINID